MKRPITFLIENLKGRAIYATLRKKGSEYYEAREKSYGGKPILSADEVSRHLRDAICSGKPYMACRFGANELATIKIFDFEVNKRYAHQLSRAHLYAGIFPETEEIGMKFAKRMIEDIPEADLIGIWPQPYEAYYIQQYGSPNLSCTWLRQLEPWTNPENPWTKALAGKKVLVVHPFTESIEQQYQKREQLFRGTDILPEFELQTLKSVQSAAGEHDNRFATWFDALEWTKNEIQKRDFDVAILGCGAYGFPLAAEIKRSGRQAIHLGGVTQLLFGILGARWDDDTVIQNYVNDAWVRPMESERPKAAGDIEDACYW